VPPDPRAWARALRARLQRAPRATPGEPAAAGGPLARLRRLPVWARAAIAVGAAAIVLVLVLALSGHGPSSLPVIGAPPTSLADPVPYDGRTPDQPPGDEQRVLVQMPRPALGDLPDARAMGAAEQRRYVASLRLEAKTTRSALEARGIHFSDVVSYGLVWNGFAATVSTRDVAQLNTPGTQVRVVRRLYPAVSEPVPVPGAAPKPTAPTGQPPVAVLDTGVAGGGGYDAVDRRNGAKPGRDPSGSGRRETSGSALAGVLVAAGERVFPIRVASLRAAAGRAVEAVGTTDELLAGLERAVDPNGDGDTSDHAPVALIGVNAPYAGFTTTPEAQAIAGAAGLGTLVVAPAGNEGAAAPGSGTVGSPAAAPDALAVGALAGPEPAPRADLIVDGDTIATAALLGGAPPTSPLTAAGPVSTTDPVALGRLARQLRGKAVIVRAGADPSAQAAAAANSGAALVLVADTRDRPLPAMAAGRGAAPVIGVTGSAAGKLLDTKPGTTVRLGAVTRGPTSDAAAQPRIDPFSAQGPSAGGLPKPELAAPGTALTTGLSGKPVVAGGTAIAAARVAAAAAKLARQRPDLAPEQLKAALIAGAVPANLPVQRAGAGALAQPATVVADPPAPVSGPLDPIRFALSVTATTTLHLATRAGATVQPATVTVRPGAPAAVAVRLTKAGAVGDGRLTATANGRVVASVPWLVRPLNVAPVPLGPLRATHGRVRFTLGAFTRGDPQAGGTSIRLADRLVLTLIDAHGHVARTLTVPGGARGLMPAEYGYTLPADALGALPPGHYRFRAQAWAPRQRQPTTGTSAPFTP
jgi:hypothetical protein